MTFLRHIALAFAAVFGMSAADAATINLGVPYRDTVSGAIYLRGAPSPYILALPQACGANQFTMGSSTTNGLPNCVQPTFSNIGSTLLTTQFPALAGGDCTTTAGSVAISCTKTAGTPFTAAATTPIGTTGAVLGLLSANKTDSGANSFTQKQTYATPTTASASINLPHGTAPTTLTNGDCWTTTAGLYCRINGATVGPYAVAAGAASPPQITSYLSGSGTYTTPVGATRLEIEGIGGGKGGGGGGTSSTANGTNGSDTSFGPVTVPGGGSATTATLGTTSGDIYASTLGAAGSQSTTAGFAASTSGSGGIYGGGGAGVLGASPGGAASTNSGAGGGGGGSSNVNGATSGFGGSSGAAFKAIITSPAASYSYSVGSGGTGGTAFSNGFAGGAGAAGRIRATAYFN